MKNLTEQNSDRANSSQIKKKSDPYIGRLLGNRYKILSLLGQGATTSVYKAQDTSHDRFAAVKILHFQFGSNEGTVNRFQQETKTISRLTHVNIAAYYDSGTTSEDEHYLVLEFADGKNLKQLIQETGAINWKRAVQLYLQICAALGAAHKLGIVHRDLKPANIIVTKDSAGNEIVKLLDFGVAKLLIQGETFQTKTQTGEMLGTLLYMSPEQCLDQDLDARSDIYSLGCVLFEALTGLPPFAARTAFETMNLHLTGLPEKLSKVRPDVKYPKQLDLIISRALAKDPKRRYQTIAALAEDLNKVDKQLPTAADLQPSKVTHITLDQEEKRRIRRFQMIISASFACVIFLVLGAQIQSLTYGSIPFIGIILFLFFEEWKFLSAKREKANPKTVKKIEAKKPAQKSGVIEERDKFDIENFAKSAFDRVDLNRDGFITKSEMKALLNDDRSGLSLHDQSFIQFVLEHYSDFQEIFDDQQKQTGISKQQILEFARNLSEN